MIKITKILENTITYIYIVWEYFNYELQHNIYIHAQEYLLHGNGLISDILYYIKLIRQTVNELTYN